MISISRQKSFGFLWPIVGLSIALLVSLGLNAYLWQRVDLVKAEAKQFKTEVHAKGEVAKVQAEKTDFWNNENLRIANEKLKTALANNDTNIKRLRQLNDSIKRSLPAPPKASSRPDLLCLDRDEYERGRREILDRFRKRIRAIADRCTTGSIKHKNLCEWSVKIQ